MAKTASTAGFHYHYLLNSKLPVGSAAVRPFFFL